MTIDVLPDDVLVEIFFYVTIKDWDANTLWWDTPNPWHALVHVCRRWRYVVFGSPHHLDLRLEYEGNGPTSEMPDAWRTLPVILIPRPSGCSPSDQQRENVVAALESEHSNRICEIHIQEYMPESHWETFAVAMQKPFPELTVLKVGVQRIPEPVLPDSFLSGSAPRLRVLELDNIPFPSIPKLLLSANGLVTLTLGNIPDSGYFSPNAIATALTVMTRLETLFLGFLSPRSLPNPANRPLPPPTRFVLPALTGLTFDGIYEYLEDLLARIDAPLLCELSITFIVDFNFDVPQLQRLIGHAKEFKAYNLAEVLIFNHNIALVLWPKSDVVQVDPRQLVELHIMCRESDWQLSSLAQVCRSFFSVISAVEELSISDPDHLSSSHWKDDMEVARWLELLNPFTSLKDLYLTHGIAQHICVALQEISEERATEVLPTLRNLFIHASGSQSFEHIQEVIRPFIAARRLSGRPVVDHWSG